MYLPTGENIKWPDGNAVAEAHKILLNAFSYDATVISDISHENTQGMDSVTVTFRNQENASDFYTVTFADGVPYPVTAYHFMEYADDGQADIANDANFVYDTAMTNAAKDFVKTVCGVDCSAASASADSVTTQSGVSALTPLCVASGSPLMLSVVADSVAVCRDDAAFPPQVRWRSGRRARKTESVTLYEAEGGDVLTLKASGDSWKIVSHLPQGDAKS